MKKFIVYLLVIILTVSLGFAVFYLVRDNEVISISSASIYKDAGESFTLDVNHVNKKRSTDVTITSSDEEIVDGSYDADDGQYRATAHKGGVARINVRTTNAKFRNLWCDVIVGDGTIESPYYISTAEQLAAIGMGAQIEKDGVATGVYAGAAGYEQYHSDLCYKLVANINVATVNNGFWVPLQNFNGRFDGNGHTISNVYIDAVGYQEAMGQNADIRFQAGKNAGLFASVGMDSVVYNLKLDDYMAVGNYGEFGVVAAVNFGTIERVEVKNAYLSINAGVTGGIVGRNESTTRLVVENNEQGNPEEKLVKVIARLDRNSVNMILGQKKTVDANGNEIISVLGTTGTIGGVAGINRGGVVVYNYVRGDVFFGDDSQSNITYGGVVGTNSAVYFSNIADENKYVGASIRDCYSDLRTTLMDAPVAASVFGGAIGVNQDYKNGEVEVEGQPSDHRVNNYLIGIYYNKDNLNHENVNASNDEIAKDFKGIGKFILDTDNVNFADKQTIVYGLTTAEMKNAENFVSHVTQELVFNDDGTSKGIVEKQVLWLFESVWAINSDTNDGMPYLNYQLIYIPDDFDSVGVPVVTNTLDDYYFEIEVTYPITILSGTDGKVRMKVEEYYQLIYSPTGIAMKWTSSNDDIVTVDDQGKLFGKNPGTATVTVTTKSGSEASVLVIVENIAYKINAPKTIYLYQKEQFELNQIEITPSPLARDEVEYSIVDSNGNATTLVTISNDKLVASATQTGTAKLTIKVADTSIDVNVVVVEVPEVDLSADKTTISGYLSDMQRDGTTTGIITITDDSSEDLEYNYTFESGSGLVDLSFDANDPSKLKYTIKGVGSATVKVGIKTALFEGKGYLYIYFNIKDDTTVTLTASPNKVTGYYSTMRKTGSATITNSAGTTLAYQVETNNSSVVTATVSGNSVNYTIKGDGNAILTVSVSTNYYRGTAYIYFTILDDAAGSSEYINLSNSSVSMYVGDTKTISASGNYLQLAWSSLDSSIASIDKNGKITANKVGTTTIVAKSDFAEARCTVYVNKRPEVVTVSISPSSVTLNPGQNRTLTASGSFSRVTWSSSNNSVATIDASGRVTAVAIGSATITATAYDSSNVARAYAYSTITVTTPTIISISYSPSSVCDGDQVTFTASVNKNVTVSWKYSGSYSNPSVNGNTLTLTASIGTIYVTASSGSASASVNVSVTTNTAYSPYIYDLDDLNRVRYNLDKDYYLAANINVGNWTPIEGFTGSLSNLGSFVISNVNVSGATNAGLFGSVSNASFKKIIIDSSTISGGSYAGALVAQASNTSFSECQSTYNTITASSYAGGIAGYLNSNSTASNCTTTSCNISTTGSNGRVGGIAGYISGSAISTPTVGGGYISISSSGHGYAGGIAGELAGAKVTKALVYNSVSISASSSTSDYAGGIAGFVGDTQSGQAITTSTIKSVVISGYHAGGIGGAMNSSKNVSVSFNTIKSGFRSEDTSTLSYTAGVTTTAVRENVTVKGTRVGGLFGELRAGVVENCYTRAKLNGTSSSSEKGGFAASIHAESHFNNNGGTGKVGLVRYCYSACTFSGSGSSYAITSSLVHNYATFGDGSNRAGYCMNYLFDDSVDGDATYYDGSNMFSSDKVKARNSTSNMKTSSTYTGKGFSGSVWNLSSGYATLKAER